MSNFDYLKKYYDNGDPSHDWSHVQRVSSLCEKFGKELSADLRVLEAAAYLHDIVNIPKSSSQRSQASRLASEKAKALLENRDFTPEEINHIATCVLEHSYSANLPPSSIESAILQDADKLDGMGAIGVMRWTTVGTRMGASYYDQTDPYARQRELDDKRYSLDHFETKLLKLYERLNTEQGKEEGRRRMDFFHSFLENLRQDISGSHQ